MMDQEGIKARVRDQFGRAAGAYVTSAGHAGGADLQRLLELAAPMAGERVLDIATGGGHTALAFASAVEEVVATDFTPAMLTAAQEFVRERGATNIHFQAADAEALPFPPDSFEIAVSRIAAHHFPDPARFLEEAARVLKPGGRFLLDDNMVPEDPELDAFMNRFERWRDPSHVRAHSRQQWCQWMEAAGLVVVHVDPLAPKTYEFLSWTGRLQMPPAERGALEAWLIGAPRRCREYFRIIAEGGHVRSLAGAYSIILARRPA